MYNKNTKENGQKVRSPVSLKNVTSESLKTTEVLLLMLELPTFIILYFSIGSDVNLIKFFGQIGTIFGEIDPQLLTIRRIIEAVRAKDLEEIFLFVDILRSIWFHTQWKDGGNPKRIVTTKMVFNNTHTSNGLLTRWWFWFLRYCHWSLVKKDTSAPFLSIIYRDYGSNKRKWFNAKKFKKQTISRRWRGRK